MSLNDGGRVNIGHSVGVVTKANLPADLCGKCSACFETLCSKRANVFSEVMLVIDNHVGYWYMLPTFQFDINLDFMYFLLQNIFM